MPDSPSDIIQPSATPTKPHYALQLAIFTVLLLPFPYLGFSIYIVMAMGGFNHSGAFGAILSLVELLAIWGIYFLLVGWLTVNAWRAFWRLLGFEGKEPKWFVEFGGLRRMKEGWIALKEGGV
jgi:hypothetical protein